MSKTVFAAHCHSCAAPLDNPEFKGPAKHLCKYCSDDDGNLKPRKSVLKNIAGWLQSWTPDLADHDAMDRAELYLQAMPAWADED